jgi:hypothetical protein
MSDDDIHDHQFEQELFRNRLFGITGHEVAGMMAATMRREFYSSASTGKNGKRTRVWRANLLGIPISVIEVCTNTMQFWQLDYHFETPEWDFDVLVEMMEHNFTGSGKPFYLTRLKNDKVKISYPIFDGDVDTFRSNMTIIKLMSLQDEEHLEDFMWPPFQPKLF